MRRLLLVFAAAVILSGCLTTRGGYYYIAVCNHTPQPLDFELLTTATVGGAPPVSATNREVVEPGGDVFLSYQPVRGRGGQPFVAEWIVAFEFESLRGPQLTLGPDDLLANPSWWGGSGWRFAIVERDGELEATDCTS